MDLILSPAEIQMNTWKPNVYIIIIQQFQDFDNEGYDIKNCLWITIEDGEDKCDIDIYEVWGWGCRGGGVGGVRVQGVGL